MLRSVTVCLYYWRLGLLADAGATRSPCEHIVPQQVVSMADRGSTGMVPKRPPAQWILTLDQTRLSECPVSESPMTAPAKSTAAIDTGAVHKLAAQRRRRHRHILGIHRDIAFFNIHSGHLHLRPRFLHPCRCPPMRSLLSPTSSTVVYAPSSIERHAHS
jgi:hypothetical protein